MQVVAGGVAGSVGSGAARVQVVGGVAGSIGCGAVWVQMVGGVAGSEVCGTARVLEGGEEVTVSEIAGVTR